ncbi:hypothetical protein HZA75_04305 [Candidatus Roizmanbacteria bacterium]|nr:hypothetical protein [Candidatus Roizmanbacteria bacterium]
MKNERVQNEASKQTPSSPQSIKNPDPTVPKSPVHKSKNNLLLIIGIAILLIIFSGVAYYLGTKRTSSPVVQNNQQTPIAKPTVTTTPLFSGQLKKLNQNLKIFKTTEDDKLNGIENEFVYYEAGKFTQGELKDYTRIIAIRPSVGPGQPLAFTLATKDYQNYILDDPDNKTTKYPENDWQNPYNVLDKNKVVSTKTFNTEQPKEITLNQNFSLYSEQFPIYTVETSKIDANHNKIYDTLLVTDYSSYQKLTSPSNNLTIYFKPYEKTNEGNLKQLTPSEKEKVQLKQKYLIGETAVIVVDSVGLPITYALTTSENIKNYSNKLVQYDIDWKNYQEKLKQYQNKQITQYPPSPNYIYLPNLGFAGSKISSLNNLRFYSDYETAIPDACATALNSNVMNVNDSNLEQIGSVSNLPLYLLKDTSHPLYTLAFKNKMDYYNQDPASWDMVNKGIKKPTFDEYIKANPLLFVKDYWNRWVALGEFDIKLPGGCGKPVIYLYPKQPTKISVKFQSPIQFTTDIPKYADFWQVMAYSNGSLVNLKPELTDCSQINTLNKGREYAQEACQKNTYPYLYWAGNINSENYPTINDGWVVDKNNLSAFFKSKLTEVGLNDNETNDFMDYWLPEMTAKNTPYYRISFLQTNDLNSLFPMTVSPTPDTTFRLFLDYSPLVDKPQNLLVPQTLNKLARKGFTLVEWGGLKKP